MNTLENDLAYLLKEKRLSYKDLLELVRDKFIDIDTAEKVLDIYTSKGEF